ncbi:phosphate signaling complex protein PhoU [Thioalkalivibrio sp. HK1]|uniref:phosphate signaling complex protein PhoU n=1 Tax=Thioalkalivibrio sp. HK1 TaxID=1469245 RepID=UPI0004716DC4|nr:phosphate signaling complex protein PhoU [Thioalkalivibrio sp. HK1]
MNQEKHTFKRFDQELAALNGTVMRMGGMVEDQIAKAMISLRDADIEGARSIVARDHVVNFLDVQADEQIMNLLALRQPMGKDLRMILSLGKTVTDLERIGDEAERIARMAIDIHSTSSAPPSPRLLKDAYRMSNLATRMLHDVLDALARLDVDKAIEVACCDAELDSEFQSALRRLSTYIMEDSRNVGHAINATFIIKSLERIGDHSKNIAEYVIFLAKGKDVRHVSPESIDSQDLD